MNKFNWQIFATVSSNVKSDNTHLPSDSRDEFRTGIFKELKFCHVFKIESFQMSTVMGNISKVKGNRIIMTVLNTKTS